MAERVAPPPPRRPSPPIPQRLSNEPVAVPELAMFDARQCTDGERIFLYAVEGWGKTTAAAHADDVCLIMTSEEDGYLTLAKRQRVPACTHALVEKWEQLIALVDSLITSERIFKHLALDALGGLETLCQDYVCRTEFAGDWGEKGFASFGKGYDRTATEFLRLIERLDRVRRRGTTILILGHVIVKPFQNPVGENFDRYEPNVHKKIAGIVSKWVDCILFGNFHTTVQTDKQTKKTKGIGGYDRVLFTVHRDAFDAKNRHGMPAKIDIPEDPASVWATINQYIQPSEKE